jgi:hypothetical protein
MDQGETMTEDQNSRSINAWSPGAMDLGKTHGMLILRDENGSVAQIMPNRLLDLMVELEQAKAECVRLRQENAALRRDKLAEQLNMNPQASRFTEAP